MSLDSSLGKILLESRWDEVKSQWDELKSERAEVGIALLIVVAMSIGIIMPNLFFLPVLSGLYIFTLPCMFAGMVLYVSDRKGFLIRRSGNALIAALLAILGLALILESGFDGLFIVLYMGWGIRSWEAWIITAFFLAFDGLVFLFGLLLISDPDRMVEDKRPYPPSVQRLDVETQTEYPRDLLARYVEQYPHNPEGVLEWHIHKKMKGGKTREQAIKELMHALLH